MRPDECRIEEILANARCPNRGTEVIGLRIGVDAGLVVIEHFVGDVPLLNLALPVTYDVENVVLEDGKEFLARQVVAVLRAVGGQPSRHL